MRTILVLLLVSSFIYSQTVYEIPFASEGNEIELAVFNDSEISLNNVKVEVLEKPEWLQIDKKEKVISEIKDIEEGKVIFRFEVEKEATVLEENTLNFQITGNGQVWNKEIKISILPPDKFELNQNYPNPFNPTTKISYTIPLVETEYIPSVRLTIYDILGSEVETLVNQEQSPGYYKVEWNANNYASGMYVYQISIKGKNSKSEVLRKKMMLLR